MKRTTKPTRDLATRRHAPEGEPPYNKGPGQPSHYRSWMNDEVIELGKQGKDRTQIAAALNTTKTTLYSWMRTFPEFFEAMELAWTHMYEVHLEQLEQMITGSDRINKGAVAALIFKLKNTVHWADRIEERVKIEEEIREKQAPRERLVVDLPFKTAELLRDLCTNCTRNVVNKYGETLPWLGKFEHNIAKPAPPLTYDRRHKNQDEDKSKVIDIEPEAVEDDEED